MMIIEKPESNYAAMVVLAFSFDRQTAFSVISPRSHHDIEPFSEVSDLNRLKIPLS
jgi:hypothetical protein